MAALIAAQRDEHRIPHTAACRALGVSRSWFYRHKDREFTAREARRQALAAEIRRLFAAHGGTYGSPRITAGLREAGWEGQQEHRRGDHARAGPGGEAEEEAPAYDPAGEGTLAGAGPGQAGLPGAAGQPQMVRRRH